jgi:threonine aldolase
MVRTKFVDLRSDTVTQPTLKMREAMLSAEVGDDVYGEDATLNILEEKAAGILGKQATLFVPSGTMGNQLAIMSHTQRGDEVIIDEGYHIVQHEVGAAAVLSGVFIRTIKSPRGIMDPGDVLNAIREDNIHYPHTGLICMENANSAGNLIPLENMDAIYKIATKNSVPVHLDGARIFNAAIALGVDVKEITKCCDSVMCCLSKGLCAPVGSILAGSEEFIKKARKNRKLLGGGMRQAGFLAAAGIIALEEMTSRLVDDHTNAKLLAQGLGQIPEIELDLAQVQINMVFFKFTRPQFDTRNFVNKMLTYKIKVNDAEGGVMRFVTNNDVTTEDISYILDCVRKSI